ncbi:MAG: molybdopterin biosynthesis protein MoeY, partial [Planctomycetes bacterium]|nr:molybdopterin biosynthesis protein MoeY [Planctomycetota bacterium]
GLQLQPLYTPVVLGAYVREDRPCFADKALWRRAQDLVQRWDDLVGDGCERVVFAARLGYARPPAARSVRLPVEQLLS